MLHVLPPVTTTDEPLEVVSEPAIWKTYRAPALPSRLRVSVPLKDAAEE
jgi:hypothetical protein